MIINMEAVLKTFEDLPEILETYFKNIPEENLDTKGNDTAWTIREHLYHIVSVQEMLYQRILKVKNEKNPVITPFFPEKETSREHLFESVQEAFTHYKELRSKQITLIHSLTGSELNKEATHPEYIKYNIPLIINHMIFHEYWHMYRIEDIWLTRDEYFS